MEKIVEDALSQTSREDRLGGALPYPEHIELISFDEVQKIIPLSKSRIYALIRERKFPPPVKIGEHRAVWIKHEVIAYRDARIRERNLNHNKERKRSC